MASIRRRAAEDRSKLSRWNFSSMPSEYGNEAGVSSFYIYFYRFSKSSKSFSFNDASSSLSLSLIPLSSSRHSFSLLFCAKCFLYSLVRRKLLLRWSFRSYISKRIYSLIPLLQSFLLNFHFCFYFSSVVTNSCDANLLENLLRLSLISRNSVKAEDKYAWHAYKYD